MRARRQSRIQFTSSEISAVENALLSRAKQLEEMKPGDQQAHMMTIQDVRIVIAHEMRKIAEELHYW